MVYKAKCIITFFFITITCFSQKNNLDFDSCMNERLKGTEIDFYKKMYVAEEKLIQLVG